LSHASDFTFSPDARRGRISTQPATVNDEFARALEKKTSSARKASDDKQHATRRSSADYEQRSARKLSADRESHAARKSSVDREGHVARKASTDHGQRAARKSSVDRENKDVIFTAADNPFHLWYPVRVRIDDDVYESAGHYLVTKSLGKRFYRVALNCTTTVTLLA